MNCKLYTYTFVSFCFGLLLKTSIILKFLLATFFSLILLYLYFLQKRMKISRVIFDGAFRLRAYKSLNKRINRVLESEFSASKTFKFYKNYRKYILRCMLIQRNLTNQYIIANQFYPFSKVFSFCFVQVTKRGCLVGTQEQRLKFNNFGSE